MRMGRSHFFVALVIAAIFAISAATAEQPLTVEDIAAKLEGAKNYSYTLSVNDGNTVTIRTTTARETDENGEMKQLSPGVWEAGSFIANRIVPFVLRKSFSPDGKGDIEMKISAGSATYVLHSTGLPESVFAVKHLAPEGAFSKWLDLHVPDATDITALSGNFHADTVETEMRDPENILAPARAAYDRNRAALIYQFNKSWLYYPPAAEMTWMLRKAKKDGALYAVAGCSDRMYAANFEVALSKGKDGKWVARKILAMEFFKGE